jgi:hypothetical protein
VNGGEWWFRIGFRKIPFFREALKPCLVVRDRSHRDSLLMRGFVEYSKGKY